MHALGEGQGQKVGRYGAARDRAACGPEMVQVRVQVQVQVLAQEQMQAAGAAALAG